MRKRSPLRRFLAYVKPYRGLVAGAAFMGILKFCLPLLFPLALKFITDDILVDQAQHASDAMNFFCGGRVAWPGGCPL
jgi:subfamily B ATP-binding cassette protein MsbA